MRSRAWAWLALALVLVGAAAIRLRLLDVPLDRDEGEYAYFGQLMLEGVPTYAGAYNLKAPGIYGAYALVLAAFGQTTAAVHTGLLLVTSLTTILVFLLASRLAGSRAGIVAAVLFAVQALNPKILGIAAYAEHFVLLPVVAGWLMVTSPGRSRRPLLLLAGGVLFGLAFLCKQSAAAFIAGGAAHLLWPTALDEDAGRRRRFRATAIFVAGVVIPLVLVVLALWRAGTLQTFWFWSFVYGSTYSAGLATGWASLVRTVTAIAPSVSVALALAAVGVAVVIRRGGPARSSLLLLVASSCLATAVGLHFRPHYFLLMLPALAMLAGIGVEALAGIPAGSRTMALRVGVPAVLMVAALLQPILTSRDVLFALEPAKVSRVIYGRNPFPESVEIARYIRERTKPGERIAVIGSEPQIYFHSGRRSATGYIYTYPLMELQPYASAMQRQMIREVEAADPRYLVFVSATRSWLVRPGSDQTIFAWFEQYQRSFTRVGVVDIVPRQETVYRWGAEALDYPPRSDVWLMVFERGRKP
jgi:Dolichyl-phosphate-mannose-protein mannosyltransferase